MAAPISKKLVHNTIVTADGTSLSYYTIGNGPGLVILHGAMNDGTGHRELAELLAPLYTVYLLSRRGRGTSGPFPESVTRIPALSSRMANGEHENGLQDVVIGGATATRSYNRLFTSAVLDVELSDVNLFLEKTKAEFILGVSSGSILVLAACLSPSSVPAFSGVRKAVIFEPPLQFSEVDTGLNVKGIRKYEDDMTAGDIPGALVSAMRLVQLGPGWIPRVAMKFLTKLLVDSQEKNKRNARSPTMADMAPTLRYDFALAEEAVGELRRFEKIANEREILLLTGAKSPEYLKVVTKELERVVNGSRRVIIQGVGHEVLCNADARGNPAKAVDALKNFLG